MQNETRADGHERGRRAKRRPNYEGYAHEERPEHLVLLNPIYKLVVAIADLLRVDQDQDKTAQTHCHDG